MTDSNLDGVPPSLLTVANPKTAKGEKRCLRPDRTPSPTWTTASRLPESILAEIPDSIQAEIERSRRISELPPASTSLGTHIESLCSQWRIKIITLLDPIPIGQSESKCSPTRLIKIRPILPPWEEMKYLIGLHEIGHLVEGHVRFWTSSPLEILEEEVAAWQWAIRESCIGLSPELRGLIAEGIKTYIDKPPSLSRSRADPPQSHPCWKLINDVASVRVDPDFWIHA